MEPVLPHSLAKRPKCFYGSESDTSTPTLVVTKDASTLMSQDGGITFTAKKLLELEFEMDLVTSADHDRTSCKGEQMPHPFPNGALKADQWHLWPKFLL